jgi:protein-tyrosine-phosphatase
MSEILFVCGGNTCRSPMAEALFNESAPAGWSAVSAGVYALEGREASRHAVDVMSSEYGIDISDHRTRFAGGELVKDADLVLCMTPEIKDALVAFLPDHHRKVFTLKRYNDPRVRFADEEIADPYGGDLDEYKACADEIKAEVDKLAAKLGRGG